MKFKRAINLDVTTKPPIFYSLCYLLGFLHLYHHFQFSTTLILFFRVGRKALADRQALLQFLALALAGVNCKCAWLVGRISMNKL